MVSSIGSVPERLLGNYYDTTKASLASRFLMLTMPVPCIYYYYYYDDDDDDDDDYYYYNYCYYYYYYYH